MRFTEAEKIKEKGRYGFEDLLQIMRVLRSEQGCPWDREQDHQSIRSCLIEETYEVVEAIDCADTALLREELGDLLFQIVFHAQIEEEKDAFSMQDVVQEISEKMVHRHPHVFGDVHVKNTDEVLSNWESIKTEEKQRNTLVSKLKAIPPMLPALMRAAKVEKKIDYAAASTREDLSKKIQNICMNIADQTSSNEEMLIGNLLLEVTALARQCGVDAEQALSKATDQMIFSVENTEK